MRGKPEIPQGGMTDLFLWFYSILFYSILYLSGKQLFLCLRFTAILMSRECSNFHFSKTKQFLFLQNLASLISLENSDSIPPEYNNPYFPRIMQFLFLQDTVILLLPEYSNHYFSEKYQFLFSKNTILLISPGYSYSNFSRIQQLIFLRNWSILNSFSSGNTVQPATHMSSSGIQWLEFLPAQESKYSNFFRIWNTHTTAFNSSCSGI